MTQIRAYRDSDLELVVALALRAWAPVYASLRAVLGDDVYLRLHPDWAADQEAAVRGSCTAEGRDVFVAVDGDDRPVGFVAVELDAYHPRMGAIDIIGVDPDHHREGTGAALTAYATEHMRARGMDIAVVETGGDPGHAPARATYAAAGFTLLPIARYFQLL